MKKLMSFSFILIGLFVTGKVMAQEKNITTDKATKERGYTVLNTGQPIVLYKYQHASHSPKEADRYVPKYYFTTRTSDVLQELTKANLKKTFPTAHAFHDALDENFKDDKELIAYDHFHKVYKVDRIFTNTVQQ